MHSYADSDCQQFTAYSPCWRSVCNLPPLCTAAVLNLSHIPQTTSSSIPRLPSFYFTETPLVVLTPPPSTCRTAAAPVLPSLALPPHGYFLHQGTTSYPDVLSGTSAQHVPLCKPPIQKCVCRDSLLLSSLPTPFNRSEQHSPSSFPFSPIPC